MADPEKAAEPRRSTSASSRTDVDAPKPAPAPSTPAEKSSSERDRVDLTKADTRLSQQPPADQTLDDLYAHLPPREADILKRQVETPTVSAGVAALYRYSSRNDIIVIVVSAVAAIASGAALPLMTVLFGNLQGTFQDYFVPGSSMTYDDFMDEIVTLILYFIYLAIGEFVSATRFCAASGVRRSSCSRGGC